MGAHSLFCAAPPDTPSAFKSRLVQVIHNKLRLDQDFYGNLRHFACSTTWISTRAYKNRESTSFRHRTSPRAPSRRPNWTNQVPRRSERAAHSPVQQHGELSVGREPSSFWSRGYSKVIDLEYQSRTILVRYAGQQKTPSAPNRRRRRGDDEGQAPERKTCSA